VARKRFIDEAAAASLVRYGPELSVLKQLMSEAGTSYRQKVHSAAAGASAIEASAARGLEQLKGIYPEAIGGIPGLSRVQALNDMAGRGVAAQESAAGARRTALQELAADRAKISGRRSDIAQEIGAFTTSEANKLSTQSADRALRVRLNTASNTQSERNSLRSAGIDPDTGNPIPHGKLDPKAKKGKVQTQAAHAKLSAGISDARDVALRLARTFAPKKGSQTRNYVDSLLRNGVDEPATRTPVYETVKTATGTKRQAKLNADGTPVYKVAPAVKVPQISAAERGAALDLIFDGHISDKHRRALNAAGFSVDTLGLPTRRNPQSPQVRLPRPRVRRTLRDSGPRVS
jgi:hypothetical protein